MPDNQETQTKPVQVQPATEPEMAGINDRRSAPPGVMRKSLQAWITIGVAVVILLLIWLTGGKAQKPSPATPSAATATLQAGTSGLDDLMRRLAEQQQQAQNATRIANAQAAQQQTSTTNPAQEAQTTAPPVDPIEEDRRKRNYTSLYSSSIALSYRESEGKPANAPQPPTPEQVAAAIANLPISGAVNTDVSSIQTPATAAASPQGKKPPSRVVPSVTAEEAGDNEYPVFEGTLLETVLVNRLNGDFSGPVLAMMTSDVYSKDRLKLLIPAGSKLLGETKQVDGFGQRRLAVFFHRLLMPDGSSVDLDRFQGLNQIGETGLKDQTNHHYLQIFGASIAVGAISGLAQAGTQPVTIDVPQSTTDTYRQGVSSSLAQSSVHILDRFLNVLPTITIREGHRVKVYLTQDLLVPEYAPRPATSPASF
ncbi:MAG TPA: TrbI/VirB10 family protein [Candidatus Angelobacter sp.]|nr:TrbI/VirB10 family protein [Candidatus Angelobacter sp.]